MSARWAVRLELSFASSAALLRCFSGIEVCARPDALWVRGTLDNPAVEPATWLLPGERFHINEKSQLVPWNHLLPIGPVPEDAWTPLSEFLKPTMQAAALPGAVGEKFSLRLVRSSTEQAAALLLATISALSAYAETASSLRLARLRFAMNSAGQVLIAGNPLPSIPGISYTLTGGIALPSGFAWSPAVANDALQSLLNLQTNEMAIFRADSTYEIIPPSAWVAATRSAIRISAQELSA